MIATSELKQLLEESFDRYCAQLSADITDEMAFPAYLRGNALSRYFFWRKLEYVIKAAALRPDTAVFDFGCGSGVLLPTLSDEGRVVWATDLHLGPAQYLTSAMKLSSVEFLDPDAWQKEIPDGRLDVIIAANVLEHIEDRKSLLRILAQKLKPDGRLVVSGPTEGELYRMGRRLIGFSGDYHVSTIYDILSDVRETGFRNVYQHKLPFIEPFCLYIIASFQSANS